eukprot:TRINITY_DN4958_c0_g1_i3.p1 TRINITY_DN4958_c0_g1~~TRINITY_DN4958_c0_g1_i3.p1  ORF type:complete len:740 (+),score=199.40 TRINITY_DN4958_c0_g1_i3:404-2623(+)
MNIPQTMEPNPAAQDWRNAAQVHSMQNGATAQMYQQAYDNGTFGRTRLGSSETLAMDSSQSQSNQVVRDREIKTVRPFQGPAAALRTIERFRMGEIHNEVPVRAGASLGTDFPEHPFLLNLDAFEGPQTNWQNIWKPEQLEKAFPEIFIRDQKNGKDIRRTISEFRRHADTNLNTDEVWYAKEVPIMHQPSCINSKKNRNCMGCSQFWKCAQGLQEEIRPWSNTDLLHFEPEHSETFLGFVGMNGSFSAQQREMLACDAANTMFYADDPNAVAIWGFVAPDNLYRLTEEDSLGSQFFDQKTFIDPSFVEKKVKVIYGIQRCGQTMVVPSMWTHWVVRMGRGLSFSASWNFLRVNHLSDARRAVEFNRSLGLFRSVNISSTVVSAAFAKIDEYDCAEVADERESIVRCLATLLPILKALILEELLAERVNLGGLAVLSYDSVVYEKLRRNGKRNLPISQLQELAQVRSCLPAWDQISEPADDDDDVNVSCSQCKYILFNTRRSCGHCKGYDLCEPCYQQIGKNHQHTMKKHRKTALQSLLDLVESIKVVLNDEEHIFAAEIAESENTNHDARESSRSGGSKKRNRSETSRESQSHHAHGKSTTNSNSNSSSEPEVATSRNSASNVASGNSSTRTKHEPMEDELKETKEFLEMMVEPSSNEPSEEEVIDCICGFNKDMGFMISCEKCFAWLHGKCVGISKRNEPEVYFCPRCVKKTTVAVNAKLSPKTFAPEERLREYKLA